MNCHCSQCRRATGSAFKPFGGIRIEALTLMTSEERILRYGDESAHDVHCKACGSLLYSSVRDHTYAHVAYGSLMDQPTLVPSMHIFVGSKAPWHQIHDKLPQFDAFPN